MILEVRNQGAMFALELIKNGDKKQANTELTQATIAKAADYSLILLACGFHGNVIRLFPALTISDELIMEGLAQLEALFKSLVE